ncbi:MAG: sugar ABC transporter permease [Clostridia bacterium]|nr:sugar ABC transporter permease [Clostridia bacterium]
MSDNAVAVQETQEEVYVSKTQVTRWQYTKREMKKKWAGYVMVAPFFIMFMAFTVVPVAVSILLSFTNFNMLELPEICWFDNYIRLFLEDDLFLTAFQNTLIFAITTGPLSYILSFLLAWFINELSPRMRSIVTFVFYGPSISGSAYLVWKLIFQGDIYGLANGFLMKMGLISKPIVFLQNTTYIVPICIVVSIWTSLGTAFLSFIAGLQGVDRSLYEAGAVDGVKNRWQELWYITLPSMKSILMFGAVLSITGAFGFGGIVNALCGNPSTDYVAWTLQHHMADYLGARFEVGYASCISIVLFVLMFGANIMIRNALSKVGR